VLNKEKKCFVEGVFSVSQQEAVSRFLEDNDLDVTTELVIRREIASSGKSRAFVNDTPVTLTQLQELSVKLVDLHRQFDTLSLGETGFQLAVMDAMAGNESLLAQYRKSFRQWQEIQRELSSLMGRISSDKKEQDYFQFLYNELEDAAFRVNELEDLEAELKLLSSAEGIKAALAGIYEQLQGQEPAIVQQLKILSHQLQPFGDQHPKIAELLERLHAAHVELDDIADEASHLSEKTGHDSARIEQVNERLAAGYKLLKKHGVKTTAELLQLKQELSGKLEAIEVLDEKATELQARLEAAETAMTELADRLGNARKKQVSPLEKQVNSLLARVGMPNASIKVHLEKSAPSISGSDDIDFLFDANKSKQYAPLRKVASGGELSRLMLCIKSLVANRMDLPTLIFDEIDTGISGEASRQVGLIMKELAHARQVICITHQPQIAGRADLHLFVYKQALGSVINTNIRILDKEERIQAIAQMLGGEKPTAAALENAREMVMN
jgi:DNA repair protein RecN (Recombination protein N)